MVTISNSVFCLKCVEDSVTTKFRKYTDDNCPDTKLCWIPQIDAILPTETKADIKPCTSWQSYHCMLRAIKKGIEASFKCPFNCEIPSMSMKLKDVYLPPFYRVKLQSLFLSDCIHFYCELLRQDGDLKKTLIRMYYHSTTVHHHNEYLLVDLATLIGSVGGSLGLFLGFSCFKAGQYLIKKTLE